MAHFYGRLQGNGGEVSRLGTIQSSLRATLSGWVLGVEVVLNYNESKKRDEVFIYKMVEGSKKLVMTLVE